MQILSIDFDYYLDTDIRTRNCDFPDGHDLMPPDVLKIVWDNRMNFTPAIRNIGLIDEYYKHMEQLKEIGYESAYRADSHRAIWDSCLKDIPGDEKLSLVHIDFHHDFYVTGGNTIDCGNWLRHLLDRHPLTDLIWVKREDSETDGLFGDFPYPMQDTIDLSGYYFDKVFLCFSPEWTPPYLRNDFEKMCDIFRN